MRESRGRLERPASCRGAPPCSCRGHARRSLKVRQDVAETVNRTARGALHGSNLGRTGEDHAHTERGDCRQPLRARRATARCGHNRLRPEGLARGSGRLREALDGGPAEPARVGARARQAPRPPGGAPGGCAVARGCGPAEEGRGRGRRQRHGRGLARHRRGRDQAVRPVLARALSRAGQRPASARDRDGSAVHRAARALLVESLRRVGRQGARRAARRALRAGGDPPARDRQLLCAAARRRAASRDEHLSRQHDVDGRELDGRDFRAESRARSRLEREPRARDPRAAYARRRRRVTRSTTSRNSRK